MLVVLKRHGRSEELKRSKVGWFCSAVGSKSLGCLQVGVRKTSPVGLDQKLVIVCKMASKKKYD